MNEPCAEPQWLEAALDRILSRAPTEEVGRTLPVLFLALARDYGIGALCPEIQAELQKIGVAAGIRDDQPAGEVQARLERFVTLLGPSPGLLLELEGVYRAHHAAVARVHGREFERVIERDPARTAPAAMSPAPEGSVRTRDLLQRATGRVALR